jgi:hypothetical protein
VFFPFSATPSENQLKTLQKTIPLVESDILADVAKKLSYIGLGFKEDGKYENFVKLTTDILNDIESEALQCFGPQTIVYIQDVITKSDTPYFHFDAQIEGSIRVMIPIMGDTTLFSQSTGQSHQGKMEVLPHNSMAIWHATGKGALHSSPPVSQDPRFSILISIITKDYTNKYNEFIDHPSIQEINQYSIANDISFPGIVEELHQDGYITYISKSICNYIGIFCSTDEFEL